MAVTAFVFPSMLAKALNKEIDLLDDAIHVSLHTSTYTPNQDTDDYFDDATNEVVGAGYTAGGAAIANDTFAYTAGTNTYAYDGDDVSWPTSTITARHAIIYDRTPASDATRPLIAWQNMGGDFTTTAGTFTVSWNAAGIWTAVFS